MRRRLVLLLFLFLFATPSTHFAQTGTPPAPGKLVDMGGWKMHLHCTGVKVPSRPTVILEAGAGDSSIEWSLVQPEVAKFARVCSYDRSGSGWSDLGPYPHSGSQIVLELEALLTRAGEGPPFVLVGHSMGGRYVRLFANAHPEKVGGMVLVDANHPDDLLFINGKLQSEVTTATGQAIPAPRLIPPLRLEDIPAEPLKQIRAAADSLGKEPLIAPYTKLPEGARAARAWAVSQPKHYAANNSPFNGDEAAALAEQTKANPQPLGDMPLLVVTRDEPITTGPQAQEREAQRQQHQAALARLSRRGRQVIAQNTGHHVQIDAPQVVVEAIREVVSVSR